MSDETEGRTGPESLTNSKEFQYLLDDLYFRLKERDDWYDQAIKYLLYGNGSAVALTIGLMGALAARGLSIGMLWLALPAFFAGILAVGIAVYRCAKCAALGRADFRKLLDEYVRGKTPYVEIFLKLPDLPSKWKNFTHACFLSAFLFMSGAVIVTYVAASGQLGSGDAPEQSPEDAIHVATKITASGDAPPGSPRSSG
jgi:hypothetical protein